MVMTLISDSSRSEPGNPHIFYKWYRQLSSWLLCRHQTTRLDDRGTTALTTCHTSVLQLRMKFWWNASLY